jgi:hypothetical protein
MSHRSKTVDADAILRRRAREERRQAEMSADTVTIADIKQAVRELDPNLAPTANAFKAMVVLLSLGQVEFDLDAICQFTGYSKRRGIVQRFMHNIESNGIYKDGKIHCEWMDEEHGGIALMCDALVATGLLTKTLDTIDDGGNHGTKEQS